MAPGHCTHTTSALPSTQARLPRGSRGQPWLWKCRQQAPGASPCRKLCQGSRRTLRQRRRGPALCPRPTRWRDMTVDHLPLPELRGGERPAPGRGSAPWSLQMEMRGLARAQNLCDLRVPHHCRLSNAFLVRGCGESTGQWLQSTPAAPCHLGGAPQSGARWPGGRRPGRWPRAQEGGITSGAWV